MTYEKVMNHYRDNHCKYCCSWNKELRHCDDCMVATAIKALEKRIPKPVDKWDNVPYGTPYYCPECEADITPVEFFRPDGSEPEEKVSYCWHCGQALDWSEQNDR